MVGLLATEAGGHAAGAATSPGFLEYAWLLPVVPAVAALLIVLLGKRLPGKGADIGMISISAVAVMAGLVLFHFVDGGGAYERTWDWSPVGLLGFGSFSLEVGVFVDGLTAVMVTMVAVVSFCVHLYSIGYMKDDPRFHWFYALLSLFTAAMLNLVVANNLIQLLIGWELVGIASYLIIGFWWESKENTNAANKAFLTTRFGDVGFMFGIFTLIFAVGTSNIPEILEASEAGAISTGLLVVSGLLLLCGAVGKSAQFPLHVWLPDAMAGPTPASALIHAATMVVAGIYLIARMFPIYVDGETAITVVGIVGAVTMLLGAVLALVQDDLKRVLAYSTISQLAYMVAALGLGSHGYTPGLFHMFTHAFFKALLFLCAGSVIHAVHSNNMSEMGGLRKTMPLTYWTFLIGTLALMGVPPFAGFWSKDEIITVAWREGEYLIWGAALLTAGLTAFYMIRALLLTFHGEYRGHAHPHESPRVMTVALVILAIPSIVVGFVGAPNLDLGFVEFNGAFGDWVFFREHVTEDFSIGYALVSLVAVGIGAALSLALYRGWRAKDPLTRLGPVYTALQRRLYIDELYMRGIVRPVQYSLAAAVNWTNTYVLDGIVNGAAALTRGLAQVVAWFDRTVIDGAVNTIGRGAGESGGLLRYLQSGNVQRYAVFLFVGVVALAIVVTRV